MSFLQAEKRRQTEWKLKTRSLSRQAKKPGLFGNRLFPFCLPVDCAHENLFADTRERIIESHDQYLAFEWVPPVDLLGELPKGHRTLTRGMGNTSIDFAVLGRFETGTVELILGEAKYTEHYPTRLVEPIVASKRLSRYTDVLRQVPWTPEVDEEHARHLATEPVFQVFRHHLLAMTLKETFPSIDNVRILHLYVCQRPATVGGYRTRSERRSRSLGGVHAGALSFVKCVQHMSPICCSGRADRTD